LILIVQVYDFKYGGDDDDDDGDDFNLFKVQPLG